MKNPVLIGPFAQILPMSNMPMRGSLSDDQLEIIPEGGILIQKGKIVKTARYQELLRQLPMHTEKQEVRPGLVLLPGFVDPHTHIAFSGSRAGDFAKRLAGKTYLEIAASGGGIWNTVIETRKASSSVLVDHIVARGMHALASGVTTVEVKSGYGLDVKNEMKLLESIAAAGQRLDIELIPTCLAAHTLPRDFEGTRTAYLQYILEELVPLILGSELTKRMDIFVEQEAFLVEEARPYLSRLKQLGFDITIHGDQFTTGGSLLGIDLGAVSVDHLEVSGEREIKAFAKSKTVATVLPGASIGLGQAFAPVRRLLDAGSVVAFGSDWNPGSAPMGDLLTQVSILATFERLTMAEVLAGITYRAARALRLSGRGSILPGFAADFTAFPCHDYREIIYHQGQMKPVRVWKNGVDVWNR